MNSRLPSTGTPGSSLSVAPRPVGEDTPTKMTSLAGHEAEIKSLTPGKTHKKEKRVTRRLEAERKELEKRLLALEDAQSKTDPRAHERDSRRLTKKQPVSTSSRSSSANAERPKSSSGFSSIFRRSRRNSASSDFDFQSAEFNKLRTDTNPPSLPLTLPERFGTAITRELQSKHGTALNLSATSKMANPAQSRLLHATAKSDDLRENWKMAEAWKAKDGREGHRSVSEQLSGRSTIIARNSETATSSATDDLDRELFSAALKHDRKSLPAPELSYDRVNRDRATRATSMPISQNQAGFYQSFNPESTPSLTTRQPEVAASEPPGSVIISPVARTCQPLNPTHSSPTGNLARRSRVDPYPRTYKSSPLALNPAVEHGLAQKDKETNISKPLTLHNPNQQTQLQSQSSALPHAEDRGRSRLPVASSNGAPRTSSRFKENFQDSPKLEPPEIPVKSDRRSQENWRTSTMSTDTLRDTPSSSLQVGVRSPFHAGSTSPDARSSRTSRDMSDSTYAVPQRSPQRAPRASQDTPGNIRGPGGFIPSHSHSRTPSHNSSHDGQSNYDTADEETPESPSFPREPMPPSNPNPSPLEAPIQEPELPISRPMQPNLPDQTRNPITILKRRSQKSKSSRKPPIAKIFVICCRCKYWHDLPSEVYARLAYPERLNESKPSPRRNNDRKPAGSRSLSFGQLPAAHAAHGSDGLDLRPAPLLPRKVSCCWCGHNMSRTCCEGWTAVVELRERHH
jgi:hypothetical protein